MINIQDIIPFMKKGWVAMDEDGEWNWWVSTGYVCCLSHGLDIAPADDWTKSLIKVGGK